MAIGALDRAPARTGLVSHSRFGWAVFVLVTLSVPITVLFPSIDTDLGVVGVLVGNATAGLLFYRGGVSLGGKEGRAWCFVGLGFMTISTGVLVVAVMNALSPDVKAFGPQDLVFITGYAVIFLGLGMLPHVTGRGAARLRVWLDGLIGAVSLASIIWVLVLADLFQGAIARTALWEQLAGFGYPMLDTISLIVVMIVAVRRGSLRFDLRLLVFGVALAAQIAADVTFISGLGEVWEDATPSFPLYLTAVSGYVLAALLVKQRPQEREYADRRTALLPMVAPYGAAALLVGFLLERILGSQMDNLTVELLLATLLVGALVVGRQAVAIRENRLHVERERASLVSSISHELRTPLTAMMGFLDILSEEDSGVEDEERLELTGIVHQQAVYMSRIVADLIMLARGKATDINLSEGPVNLRSVIDSAITTVSEGNGATDVSCASGLVLYADRDRLQQVLVNLVANAVRYGGDYRAIVARVERDDIVIEVHDNGPGIPPRYALSIWERFERGPNRYNAVKPGSGIGLAVVEAVAKAHGGSATYERSALLGGACFRVRLPAHRMVPPAVPEPSAAVG